MVMPNRDEEEISVRISEVVDLPGKKIAVKIGATYVAPNNLTRPQRIVSEYRCPEEENTCQKCTLKFICYSSDTLEIDYKELNLPEEEPISDKVKKYIEAHQV